VIFQKRHGSIRGVFFVWGLGSETVCFPILHQGSSLLQQGATGIGRLGLVLELMGQGMLNDLPRMAGFFTCPIPEGGSEAVNRDVGLHGKSRGSWAVRLLLLDL